MSGLQFGILYGAIKNIGGFALLGSIFILFLPNENMFASVNFEGVVLSEPDTPLVFHPNQYFVELDSLVHEDTVLALLAEYNSIEVWENDDINLAVWEVISFPFTTPNGEEIFDINGVITSAKKKTKISSTALNVQQTVDRFHVASQMGCFDISDFVGMPGDETIKISILDTGISDLTDNSSADNNFNLIQYSGYDYVDHDSIPDDEHGHGTHLAGIIYNITHHLDPQNTSITYDIRKTHDAQGQAYTSNVVFALLDAIRENADIINMSFSVNDAYHDTLFFPLQHALIKAEKEGVLVIAAAGNTSLDNDISQNTTLPSSFPLENIISVGSSSCDHSLSEFSSFGSEQVDVIAIGESIPGPDLGSGVVFLSGTSQSTALVTAISALLGSNQLEFNYQKIKCILINSSIHYTDLGDKSLSDGEISFKEAAKYEQAPCDLLLNNCLTEWIGDMALDGLLNEHAMFETNLQIESSQKIGSSLHVTYDAINGTSFLPGFELISGSKVVVQNTGCLD